jgi:hypothetical protein
VDQSVVKPLQARLRAQLDELQSRLDAEYARNVQAKRDMIARVAELANLEDTRRAIEESKGLQRAWKAVGLVPRHQDNALWEEFRRNCDAVFARSAQEFAARCSLGPARRGDHRAKNWNGWAPGEPAAAIKQSTNPHRFESLVATASARPGQRYSATDHCADPYAGTARPLRAAAGLTCLRPQPGSAPTRRPPGRSQDECESLRATAAWRPRARAEGDARLLEQQMEKIAAGEVSTDLAANEATLRLLCIRAELIADTATPPEDLPLRREYQMQRLVASMGRGERAAPTDLDGLALEWLAVGPVEAAVHDALYARFERCRSTG